MSAPFEPPRNEEHSEDYGGCNCPLFKIFVSSVSLGLKGPLNLVALQLSACYELTAGREFRPEKVAQAIAE